MKKIFSIYYGLLKKDFCNLGKSILPSTLLGVPLFLLLQFIQTEAYKIHFLGALFAAYFFSSTSLFYRSFGGEHWNKNFQIYSAFGIRSIHLFVSQALVHFIALNLLFAVYLFFSSVLWNVYVDHFCRLLMTSGLLALALAPLGTLLGLLLQTEREFLFSVIYLPLATPAILAGFQLASSESSTGDLNEAWLKVLGIFALLLGFLSALIFDFFFDDLSESL